MKTAVEWFELELKDKLGEIVINQNWKLLENIIKQAKKMEKKQIMEAWLITKPVTFNNWKNEFEQYYNETFKSE
jgi:adenylate kinase